MRERALAFLACPQCSGELALEATQRTGEHVEAGSLACTGCGARYAILRGVPRFAPPPAGGVAERTARAFGYEWTRYAALADRYRQQFLDWLRPVPPDFFRDKLVLEGGCGKGRHTVLAAEFGARDVVALDLSAAVDVAYAHTRDRPNIHVLQADLLRPPLKRVFDYAFSIGVLHHLPAPEQGFRALVSRVRAGGAVSAWVYGREGNGWIVHLVSPLRERVTSRLPHTLLDVLAALLTVPLHLLSRLVYRPARERALARALPYAEYLGYIADFPFREQRSIVFDHLVAPVAFYLRQDEFRDWFQRAALEDVAIQHHNANSWRGFARVPLRAAAS